jgi:hypothetical protein
MVRDSGINLIHVVITEGVIGKCRSAAAFPHHNQPNKPPTLAFLTKTLRGGPEFGFIQPRWAILVF